MLDYRHAVGVIYDRDARCQDGVQPHVCLQPLQCYERRDTTGFSKNIVQVCNEAGGNSSAVQASSFYTDAYAEEGSRRENG